MSIFPFLFLGAMLFTHLYLFWSVRRALPPGKTGLRVAAGATLAAGLGAFLSRRYFRQWEPVFEKLLFIYLGFVLVAVAFLVAWDIVRAAAILLGRRRGLDTSRFFSGQRGARIGLALACLGFAYALAEAQWVRASPVTIRTAKLPPDRPRLRIVAVSDVHLTRRGDSDRLARLVREINRQKPDMVVMLGDLVDDRIAEMTELSDILLTLDAPLGKFAVLGNHELYNGVEQSVRFTANAGFRILRGESVDAGGITLVGVDDPVFQMTRGAAETLAKTTSDLFTLFLIHRPVTPPEAIGRFDLQISGHTHGGQLIPTRIVTWLLFRHSQGMNELVGGDGKKRSLLYLTNGAGYWGPPVRLFAPPEIVVIDLVREE